MHPKVEIGSLAISKSEENQSAFIKYDIDASIEEFKVTEDFSKLKFSFTILSDPKNIRLTADGFATIVGKESKREKVLVNDENNIPKILNQIYQNLYPTFFMATKCIEVPCPPYMLGGLSKASADSPEQEIIKQEIKTEETPQEIKTEETPQEIKTEETPQEIKTEEKPQETQTEEKPATERLQELLEKSGK